MKTKCSNTTCPARELCRRWTDRPSQFQAYLLFYYTKTPGKGLGCVCQWFVDRDDPREPDDVFNVIPFPLKRQDKGLLAMGG